MAIAEIDGYGGRYFVCDDGTIFSTKANRALVPVPAKGYGRVRLYKSSHEYKWHMVHRLVATHFVSGDHSLQVNHIDGNIANNRSDNLEFVTQSQNMLHRFRVLGQKGSQLGRCGAASHRSKAVVMDCGDGSAFVFPSAMDAQRSTGFDNSSIGRAARGLAKFCRGYRWSYV
jgi:hypothetical protein